MSLKFEKSERFRFFAFDKEAAMHLKPSGDLIATKISGKISPEYLLISKP
jgi:hypothetical protein